MESSRVEISLEGGRSLALRPASDEDYEDLVRIYAGTRADELAQVSWWDDEQKLAFCRSQYEAQKMEYDARFPDAEYDVILLEGRMVGRLWVVRGDEEIRLLDIALVPEAQNRGVGTALLKRLIDESRQTGKRLRHMVFVLNEAALRFYDRLGFEVFEDLGGYKHMEWKSDK
ncbi:MAG TPA: GNAT family N-acetyltransferase [Pyrinomonadaceae bacterium]|nr:GNAT family N-acetyltransferase [Pyrinomonadaceae bacterium]